MLKRSYERSSVKPGVCLQANVCGFLRTVGLSCPSCNHATCARRNVRYREFEKILSRVCCAESGNFDHRCTENLFSRQPEGDWIRSSFHLRFLLLFPVFDRVTLFLVQIQIPLKPFLACPGDLFPTDFTFREELLGFDRSDPDL